MAGAATQRHLRAMRGAAWAAAFVVALTAAEPRSLADDGPPAVLCGIFRDEARADSALERLKQSEEQGLLAIDAYTVLAKGADGVVSRRIDFPSEVPGTGDPLRGAAAVAAVLGGVVGLLVGRWEGGFIGYVGGIEETTPEPDVDPVLEGVEESVEPGQAMVIARVREKAGLDASPDLRPLRARQRLERDLPTLRTTPRGRPLPVESIPPEAARVMIPSGCPVVP